MPVPLQAQAWLADDPSENDGETFETVTCLACSQVHFINPKPGEHWGPTSQSVAPEKKGQNG
jgi:hypothetical protein